MNQKAIQDYYPDEYAHCYGCGHQNSHGLHIKSYQDGEETVCHFTPGPQYTGGYPGNIYGGLLASLIDCHAAATASSAKLRELGFAPDEKPPSRFVTASLKVDFIKPAPSGKTLELRGKAVEIKNRKVTVSVTVSADNETKATGEVIMIQLQEIPGQENLSIVGL